MKQHIYGCLAILKGDVQPLEREELDPYGLKLPLLHGHILVVSKLVCRHEAVGNAHIQRTVVSPTNCGDMLQYIKAWFAHGMTSAACRASSGAEEHDITQPPTSQFC